MYPWDILFAVIPVEYSRDFNDYLRSMLPKMHHDANTWGGERGRYKLQVFCTPFLACSCYYPYLSLMCHFTFWQQLLFLILYGKINCNMCLIQTVYHLSSHVKWLIMFKTNSNRLEARNILWKNNFLLILT